MKIVNALGISLLQLGFDPRVTARTLRGIPAFVRDFLSYRRKLRRSANGMPIGALLPITGERYLRSGALPRHYFHQDLWAARRIFAANPARHVDIGSSIEGFIAHLLVFRPVEIVDVRPAPPVPGLTAQVGDATLLPMFADNSLESVSSLHACEHFGLGRYGDPVNPDGHVVFMKSLARVLKPGGRLYFSVPSGIERLYFNSHRVMAPETVLAAFGGLELVSFSCVKDDDVFYPDCPPAEVARAEYGCGFYEFTKR
jgi:SAM-dependent methyltransferase